MKVGLSFQEQQQKWKNLKKNSSWIFPVNKIKKTEHNLDLLTLLKPINDIFQK